MIRALALALCAGLLGCSAEVRIEHGSDLRMDTQGNDLVITNNERTVIFRGARSFGKMDTTMEAGRVSVDFPAAHKALVWEGTTVTFAGRTIPLPRPGTYEVDPDGNVMSAPQ